MRIDLLAIGSQGDVQPLVALAVGLRSAGHAVRVVTMGGFEELVSSRGLEHLSIGSRPQDISGSESGRDWVKQRATPLGFLKGFVRIAGTLLEEGMARYAESRRDAEAIIVSSMGYLIGVHLAEWLKVPLVIVNLAPPVIPTRYDWEGAKTFGTAVRGQLNAAVHAFFQLLLWTKLRPKTNLARRNVLNLPPLRLTEPLRARYLKQPTMLCAYSPVVVARVPDWGPWMHVTGYWFLDELPGKLPPEELVLFLASGAPPVFVGFGSTPFPEPEATTALVVRALERAGRRGVILAGGSGLATGRLSEGVLSVDSVSHTWLFSRVSAAVHHGGAGVTGAVLRAGLPSVVVPVFADQPFWGSRVLKLGAGPTPIPAKSLTEENLTAAIQATAGDEMRHRAAAIGEQIRQEDGVGRAVAIIEESIGTGIGSPVARSQHAS